MSWQQLESIKAEAVESVRSEQVAPPVACPEDGTPLVQGAKGVLGCRWCGWRSTDQ